MQELFREKFNGILETKKSLVCVGLDPDPGRMPSDNTVEFCVNIIDAVQKHVSAIKPNLAFFEAMGLDGLVDLKSVLDYVSTRYPDLLVIGDGKRGDIGSTSGQYARAMFEHWGFHAITVNAFAGYDSVKPFLEYRDRGIFVWCKSSNPDGGQLQDLYVDGSNSERFYQRLASLISSWDHYGNVGLVVGATYPDELKNVRQLCPEMPFLVPGVGSQSGDLEGSLKAGIGEENHAVLINSSRSIIYASEKIDDYADKASSTARSLNEKIDDTLSDMGRSFI